MFSRIHFWVPLELTLPTIGDLLTGDPNPFYPLVLFINDNTPKNQVPVTDGSRLDRYTLDGQTYHWHCEVDQNLFSLQVCGLIVHNGGDVSGYPLWVQIDPEAQIPGDDEERPTWQQLVDSNPNLSFIEIGEDRYVPSSALSNNNDYMLVSQAIGLFGIENLITQAQIAELIANAPQPEPEEFLEN